MSGPGITPLWENARRSCRIRNEYVREAIAEFIGTGILCLFAVGAGQGGGSAGGGWGPILGLMTAIYIVGGVSGGHVNPAVTLGLAIGGQVSWFKVPLYWLAQFFGGYVGSCLGALLYDAKNSGYDDNTSACIAFRADAGMAKVGTGFADQIVMTAIFMMAIYSLIDKRNMGVPKHLVPFLLSLVLGSIGWTYGYNAGAPLNPARDLTPRLAALSFGCKTELLMKNAHDEEWWLVGFFGPFIGAMTGALLYIILIGAHLDGDDDDVEDVLRHLGPNPEYMPTRFIPPAQPAPKMSQPPAPRFVPDNRGGAINQGYEGGGYRGGY